MNNMPGFNAVLSLSRPTRSYRTGGSGIPSAISLSVMTPAVMVGGGGLGFSCVGNCRAVALACYLACGLLGPLGAAVCLVACKSAKDDCVDDCKGGLAGIGSENWGFIG